MAVTGIDLGALTRGEKSAWDAFVRRYAGLILSAVRGVARDGGDVEDLVQEVFTRLCKDDFRLVKAYDPARAGITTWLTIVARSTARDALRRRQPSVTPLDAVPEALLAVEDRHVEPLKLPDELLSPRQKLVISMIYDRDMDVTEIAAALGIDPQTVRSTHHKAMLKLRSHFAVEGDSRASPGTGRPNLKDGDELAARREECHEEFTMTGPGERAKDAALWQRWRQHAHPMPRFGSAEPMALAAYAEGRLDEAQAEPIEDWLAAHPEALADLAAARAAASSPLPQASEQLIARAAALVQSPGGANVVRFRRAASARRPQWRMAMAWGGIAASLLITSMVGFALGDNAYLNLVGEPAAAESTIHELLDPPGALFADDDEPAT